MALQRDKKNIIVGEAAFFYAPLDSVKPADSVALYAGWGEPWIHPGYTEEGVSTNFERETQDHNVEEDPLPAMRTTTTATFTVSMSFAEVTLENMRLAYGGGVLTTNGSNKSTLVLSQELEEMMIGFEGKAPNGKMRRIIIPRVVSAGSVESANRRSESKTLFPAEFSSLCRLDEIDIADLPAEGVPAV